MWYNDCVYYKHNDETVIMWFIGILNWFLLIGGEKV